MLCILVCNLLLVYLPYVIIHVLLLVVIKLTSQSQQFHCVKGAGLEAQVNMAYCYASERRDTWELRSLHLEVSYSWS